MENSQRLKKRSAFIAAAIILIILAIVLRGPQVSNALKKLILPELEAATGKRVIASKIYINIFPFFVEAKDLKVFGDHGEKVLLAKRVKAYIELSGLFSRTLTIRRLVIREPVVLTDENEVKAIEQSIREYLAKTRKDAIKVKVLAVEIQGGSGQFRSESFKTSLGVDGLRGEVILGGAPRILIDTQSLRVAREGLPEIAGGVSARLSLNKDVMVIHRAAVDIMGSHAAASGEYSRDGIELKTSATIIIATVKKLFGLQKNGDGGIKMDGTVNYRKDNVTVDLAVTGNFYLETLMELLKVKERLEGMISVKGKIGGPLRDLSAQGEATLTKGNLYNV
ncbi:MAG TPA: hypothetical protein VEP69_02160, partial [Thermodesulfovibrionales bacterium]|nr:hypothetical protein [Thermodesulfovibrionales bacterium]